METMSMQIISELKEKNKKCDLMQNCKQCVKVSEYMEEDTPCNIIRKKYGVSIWDSKKECRKMIDKEGQAINKAESFLTRKGYIVKKITKAMEKDCKRCEQMQEQGQDMDCSCCACSICIMQ